MSGTVSTRIVVVQEDSGLLGQCKDIIITSATHDESIKYDSTNWVNSTISLTDLSDTNLISSNHNDILLWNAATNQWENGKLSSLLSFGSISIKLSVYIGQTLGNTAKHLCAAFTDDTENNKTLAMASCGDNNAIYKKEPTDTTFTFLTTLQKGESYTANLPAGTVFQSEHGIAGASDPFPTSFGVSCLSDTYFRFYALRQYVCVYVVSAGRDCLVTLYASDETTIVDGPVFISAYGYTRLSCTGGAEYVVTGTTEIFCGTGTSSSTTLSNASLDQRLLCPMKCELIVHNASNRVTAQYADTTVTWYRQNMTQGTVTVNSGTPYTIGNTANAGSTSAYGNDGWLILRSNKPISSFCYGDGAGTNSTEAWPMDSLAQLFPIYSAIVSTSLNFAINGIYIVSPYEGTASIYDSSRTLVFTFNYTRGVTPATTVEHQMYPASGRSNPGTDGYANLVSGWVETTTPSSCVMNFNGSSVFTSDNGDETTIPGTTPEYLRAHIRKDSDGMMRRRDIDTSGNETWVIC